MKKFLVASLLLLAPGLRAQPVVVYAKGDFTVLTSSTPLPRPADPARAAFFTAFQADLARPSAFPPPLKLIAPPNWGRTVPGAEGLIQFHDSFPGGFIVRVALQGLAPDHRYILTLNGNPERAGNSQLVDPVPGNEKEKYYDFQTITTDPQGRCEARFGIILPAGPYDVRFYVKDTDDFKIVLYHDFFRFKVE